MPLPHNVSPNGRVMLAHGHPWHLIRRIQQGAQYLIRKGIVQQQGYDINTSERQYRLRGNVPGRLRRAQQRRDIEAHLDLKNAAE